MRAFIASAAAVCILLSLPAPAAAPPQDPNEDSEKYLPVHAVLSIRGTGLSRESDEDVKCTPHGFIVLWEGDLEPTDDDPDGVFPAASYEVFDGPFATLKFDDWVCRQKGLADRRYTHLYGSRPSASVRLVLVGYGADGKYGRDQAVIFDGFELGYVKTSGDETEPSGINLDARMDSRNLTPALALTAEDFERGFERSYHFGGVCESDDPAPFACGHQDDYRIEGTLTLSYKQDTEKPKVEIAGCAHLLPGGSKQLTATGRPSGGKYKWSAEPASVLNVSGSGSGASVKAGKTGRATVRVEYEAKNGKKAEAKLAGSVVTLRSVNGGAPIPTINLEDAYGNSTATIEVATVQDPADGDLLRFDVADPGIATVTNLGSSILIQGVRVGVTSAQARTQCGDKIGPVIAIEVAGCDPESVARLRQQYKEVKSKLDESVSRVNKVLTSEEFIESSDGMKGDIIDAAVEAADLAAGGMANAKAASNAVKVAHEIIEAGSFGWDVYRNGAKATLIKAGVTVLVPGGAGLVSVYDKATAFGKLAKDVAVLVDADERIAREQPIQDGYTKELEQIDRLIEKCKKEGKGGQQPGEPGKPSKPPPTPAAQKGKPGGGKPGGDQSAPSESTTPSQPGEPTQPGQAGGSELGGGEPQKPTVPPVVEPPTPPAKPDGGVTVGLPIECGCKSASTAAWRDETSGLAAIAASLSLLRQCTENYESELERFQADSSSTVRAARAVEAALATPGEKGFKMLEAALPGLTAATNSLERVAKAAGDFASSLEGCDKKLPEAVELMKKAGTALGTTPAEVKPK